MSDPTRLLEEDALSREERRVLEAALSERPPSGEKRAVLGAVLAQLPALPNGGAPAGGLEAATSALAAKAAGGALTMGVLAKSAAIGFGLGVAATAGWVGANAFSGTPGVHSPKVVESALGVAPAPPPNATPQATPRAPAPEARLDAHDAVSAPNPKRQELPASPLPGDVPSETPGPSSRAFPDVDGAAPPSTESRRVAEARALLRSGRADDALVALSAIGREFPRGALVQEREALAIEALMLAGNRDAARARAKTFLERYPTSPHAAAARRALE